MSTNIHILLFLISYCSSMFFSKIPREKVGSSALDTSDWKSLWKNFHRLFSTKPGKVQFNLKNIESCELNSKTLKHRTLHDMSNSNKNGSGAKKRKITASTTGTMRVKVSALGRFVILFFSNAPLTFTLRSRRLCVSSSSSSSTGWARPNAQGRRHHGRHQR